jgi:hypothetical protein
MKLPQRVRNHGVGWVRFVVCLILDSILSLCLLIGPPLALYKWLSPSFFIERFITVGVCLVVCVVSGFATLLFWGWFITETTGW